MTFTCPILIDVHLEYYSSSPTADNFMLPLGEFELAVSPLIEVSLEANNTAVPIDLIRSTNLTSDLTAFDFGGTVNTQVGVGIDDLPVRMYFSASSDDITDLTSLDYTVGVDIDLDPIKEGK